MLSPYNEGWIDFRKGYYLNENPFYSGAWEYEEWCEGWLDARDSYYWDAYDYYYNDDWWY